MDNTLKEMIETALQCQLFDWENRTEYVKLTRKADEESEEEMCQSKVMKWREAINKFREYIEKEGQ